jgi:diguanylate cyclase (GGDEF)-like protein
MEDEPRQLPSEVESTLEILSCIVFGDRPPRSVPASLEDHPPFSRLCRALSDIKDFTLALSQGDLSASLRQRGILAGALKSLQANLKHLTWQAQRIATGDFTQRVDFIGEFSEAFNTMVRNLDEARRQLLDNEARLEKLATTDSLTGLLNRRQFFSLASRFHEQGRRYDRPTSVILLDIDYFKKINDSYGHAAGDQVLQEVARICLGQVRQIDLVARYGGEEFVVLLPETPSDRAFEVAERLRLAIGESLFSFQGQEIRITISLGISSLADRLDSSTEAIIEQAVNRADQALYRSKNEGRNRSTLSE